MALLTPILDVLVFNGFWFVSFLLGKRCQAYHQNVPRGTHWPCMRFRGHRGRHSDFRQDRW